MRDICLVNKCFEKIQFENTILKQIPCPLIGILDGIFRKSVILGQNHGFHGNVRFPAFLAFYVILQFSVF